VNLSFANSIYWALATFALASFSTRCRADNPATGPTPLAGEFKITFDDRSPLSAFDKLAVRLNQHDIGSDYDLRDEPFVGFVPTSVSADQPLGIVVFMSQDGANGPPQALEPVLEKRHLIFIMARNANLALGEETGLAIDAVFNLKQRFRVDARRIFLMGSGWIETAGLATPDVFAGDVWIWNTGYWKDFPINSTQFYRATGHAPSPAMLSLARRRPHVFGFETDNYNDGIRSLIPGVMAHDGFEHVMKAVIADDDIHPELKPQWFEKMLDTLESVSLAAKPPATRSDETAAPLSMLRIAEAYLAAGQKELARRKLQAIVSKYPDDPAAAQARKLLEQNP
jgi:hypothetical protein